MFWALENCNTTNKTLRKSEDFWESHFLKTHTRDITGSFVVGIPFKENVGEIGNSREQAIQGFLKRKTIIKKSFVKN